MKISQDEVRKIATLAHLEFDDRELEEFSAQFQQILNYFEQLQQVKTSGVDPLTHPLEEEPGTPLREDVRRPSLSNEEALAEAPKKSDGQFQVPRVIDAE